jgi:ribosomal protein S18 acetylase RimI-like enzyme/ubiquinone/menaquinone biosynthesis C-methylase UbiE
MVVGALAVIVGAEVYGAAVRTRTLSSATAWLDVLVRTAVAEASLFSPPTRSWKTATGAANPDAGSDKTAGFVASLGLGLLGLISLGASGHAPEQVLAVAAFLSLAVAGIVVARRCPEPRRVRGRRGPAAASALVSDVSLAAALMVALAVVAHTGGLNALSFFEAASIAAITALAVRLGPLPRGLISADAVFVIPLTWIGVPLDVALAALVVWRLGSLIVIMAAAALARATAPVDARRDPPRDRGRFLHRFSFRLVSLLPPALGANARAAVFDAMFVRSPDPWAYSDNAYERHKQRSLINAVGTDASFILEVGCANGHNLCALADRFPEMLIAGTDVSPKAVSYARAATAHKANVHVWTVAEMDDRVRELGATIDCIVLSEVLYYMGSADAIEAALKGVSRLVKPGTRVVMVHGSSDARWLHAAAIRALHLVEVEENLVTDGCRTYVVNIARFADRFPDTEVRIRPAGRQQAGAMARIHRREFPVSLYSRMGTRFLTVLYRQWMRAQGSFAVVASDRDGIVGFAVGTHATYRCRGRDLVRSTFAAVVALAVRPVLWRRACLHYARMLKRMLHGGRRNSDSELTFIAVERGYRQRGIGSLLLAAFEEAARADGSARCTLVTEEVNVVAREFYVNRGWRVHGLTRSADGRALVRLETGSRGT